MGYVSDASANAVIARYSEGSCDLDCNGREIAGVKIWCTLLPGEYFPSDVPGYYIV